MAIISDDGEVRTNERAQEMIRESMARNGGWFFMMAYVEPAIGEVQEFAGLPFRVVRYISRTEAEAAEAKTRDIWGSTAENLEGMFYFEVEVAD